ncbi:uncharacterized protein LOC122396708 [Colletes gigas]|uniref:uncharacterized protein LOC122396708 n=1 Tax=Colletes gigas TaxID=935657 RepID=UPI001C9A600B|nr:uncharacterized protein LOC122396708 [Colletes gigas]
MPISLRTLCLVTLVLCNIHGSLEHEIPRRSFLSRRAIDGTRGRKYFDPEEEGAFDSYGSAGGQYDPYEERTDLSDIRRNVPGEPGVDYPAYTTLPQTGFTCEGRSRGYYADEVAGCQVFHVCHDVLVSSFLCPIGSIFSQKLLTCDWWTKVDCSSSEKYIDVNRNSYQQDDDEMIRNAYAMISLQSGTDVTKDGLVDPDRTGSVVDYQRGTGTGRVPDYSSVDSTGNDLRSNFEDYPRPVHDFLPPYQFKERKQETSRNYQERFYPQEKSRSPYQDSPIIRVQTLNDPGHGTHQQRTRDFQDSYRRPNEFNDQFQPSYAPTVPTVTTTTRRFYSPTVPTTYRPSTLAYNKLDQVIDSSDYFFSHSGTKSYVTPPTRIFPNDQQASKKTNPARKANREDYDRPQSYQDDYTDLTSEEERRDSPRERFQVRVAEDLRFNRSNLQNDNSPSFEEAYQGFQGDENVDDIETRGSIGLGHALRQPFRGISVQEQNPVEDKAKGAAFNASFDAHDRKDYQYITGRPVSNVETTTQQYQRDDQRRSETFVPTTTPSYIESTIRVSTIDSSSNFDQTKTHPSLINASSNLKNHSESFELPRILKTSETTRSKFQIKVPELSEVSSLSIRYSSHAGTRTTELPGFQKDYTDQSTAYDENIGVTSNYDNSGSRYYSTIKADSLQPEVPRVSSTIASESSGLGLSFASKNKTKEIIDDFTVRDSVEAPSSKVPCFDQTGEPCNTTKLEKTMKVTTVSSSSSYSVGNFDEIPTQRLHKQTPVSLLESVSKPVAQRSVEKSTGKLETVDKGDLVESSTANALLRSIQPKTVKEIEEAIDRNNSSYQVTLTLNKDEELVPIEEDLIDKLISQQDKTAHELKIIKSVEPEIPTTTSNALDVKDRLNIENNFTDDSKKQNFNSVSLLQLMSELLRLDRAPRPFSLDAQRPELKTIAKEVKSTTQLRDLSRSQETSTESGNKSSVIPLPLLKKQILGQLMQNFGEPIYRADRQLVFDLPKEERSLDFQTGLPLKSSNRNDESSSGFEVETSSTAKTFPTTSNEVTTTTTPVPRTVTTDSTKTVVKTELVPSIGFSLNTDEGREEYVEAVLGGLIEPEPAESEKKETIVSGKVEEQTKNETSVTV